MEWENYLSWQNKEAYVQQILQHYPGWETWDLKPSDEIEGVIYLLENPAKNICKIGFSRNHKLRVSQVLCAIKDLPQRYKGHRNEWFVASSITGVMSTELNFHKELAPHRISDIATKVTAHNEWYPMSDTIVQLSIQKLFSLNG